MRTLSSLDQFLVSVGAVKKTVSGRNEDDGKTEKWKIQL
jgi:hypothetical protein